MKKYVILFLAFFAMAITKATAQKFATHTVKEGETLQSISRQYRVTPFTIIQSNKEIKTAEDIKPNTILIIPLDGKLVQQEEKKEEVEEQEVKPLGFSRHRVRKRETLYGLTERYKITEEQLKRYNRRLYSEPLKKGMVLQIPKYPIPDPNEEKELDFEVYTVQPKETRWSIAHKYGISVDSLVVLNPELGSSSDYLAIGQELKLPRPKGDSLDNQEVNLYTSYTVPSKQTLYSLGREYGIPSDSILKLNPEVVKQGGLKEGMVLRLPKKKDVSGEVNTENFIFYEVKPKQNIFRLTQNLNISRDELFSLNPALENGLKAGMVLKLPKDKSDGLEVKNALILDKVNLQDSINVQNRLNVVFMLPFRLDRINLNDRKKTESQIKTRRDLALSLGFYSGAMVALDSIKQLGVSVNVKTFDTQLNQNKVKEILFRENLYGTSAVIGPIASSALDEVAVQTASQNIPIISPTASNSALGHKNVFYSVPKEEVLRGKMLEYLKKIRKDQNVIIVADSTHTAAHDTILSIFPAAQIAKVIDNKSLHLDEFLIQLSEEKENWVFLETDQANMVSSVSSILNSANTEEMKVRMFTTSFNNAFENDAVSKTHLSNLKFSYPSFYKEGDNDAFTKAYRRRFRGVKPDRYATRGFDLTFDVLLKLAHKNNLFETSKIVGTTEYSGNSFDYYKDWSSGYHNHAGYIMEYDSLRIKQVELDDLKSDL
ncbi:LysM peptidoglycan-binding domain-containing protein [Flagellimonas meridianipacifica]|uniref:ABC-type branched-subunit amino acid transport system substrate-binding protein n=1 Tax=Flagellimonas meridianipacifica TaxID=1080225 RepID=A0A2T0MDD7_9FLAO|nr:LysM peptidoglycan-binding domain-containing protein [Allomuricauda pacifica]PRX55510.1 ABC-type branched-subunit amino acid transport system substrate-binding protein [Allomuricauda pacifica]